VLKVKTTMPHNSDGSKASKRLERRMDDNSMDEGADFDGATEEIEDQIEDTPAQPLDNIEEVTEEIGNPVRDNGSEALDKIPDGPLDNLGSGSLVGAVGYYAISTGQTAVLPIPGVRQPGYKTISHGAEEMGEFERHTIKINAASQKVAEFAAKYEVAAPSNIDFILSETEIRSSEVVTKRPTFSTWEIVVDVADLGQTER